VSFANSIFVFLKEVPQTVGSILILDTEPLSSSKPGQRVIRFSSFGVEFQA